MSNVMILGVVLKYHWKGEVTIECARWGAIGTGLSKTVIKTPSSLFQPVAVASWRSVKTLFFEEELV